LIGEGILRSIASLIKGFRQFWRITMYAVVNNGGKQYKVETGQIIQVEKIESALGTEIEFKEVLMLVDGDSIRVGTPYLEGCSVTAKICEQGRDKKIHILKFKRRKHHMKRQGHRQWFTKAEITAIKK